MSACSCPRPAPRGRRARLALLGGVLASMVPVVTATTPAVGADGSDAAAAYGGFTTSATATPIRVEIFEPSIPIPVDAGKAQVELNLGYAKVRADSGQSTGRSSLFWPGDPVGEGLKTFAEQLGFPPSPLTDGGYPVQVNAQFPGDTPTQADERIPGSIQRTTAGDRTAIAETGFSPDGAVRGPDADDDGKGAPGAGANPLSGLTDQLTGLLSGGLGGLGALGGKPSSATANPLAALVDADGYVAVSRTDASKGPVVAASRATLGEVRLLGGLITLGGVETVARASTDGAKATTGGSTKYGTFAIAGQKFSIGPDGIESMGVLTPIPGLKDLPAAALQQLGVSIEAPEKVRDVAGDQGTSTSEGIRITIDLKTLAPLLRALPTSVLGDLIPAEAGPLRGIVSGLSNLSPRIVITLGYAQAVVDTVPPIAPPPATPPAPAPAGGAPAAAGGAAGGGAVGVPSTVPGAPAPAGAVPTAAPGGGGDVDSLVDAAPRSAGLPELASIPTLLLVAAFAGAAFAGTWLRRMGVAALGGGAPCSHGLASGLPDLRKA